MKTIKIITIVMMMATLSVGCTKEKISRISIYSEPFGVNSKVMIDTTNVSSGSGWINGEEVNINGAAYPIVIQNDSYYIDITSNPPAGALYAIYPSSIQEVGGNSIRVTNSGNSNMKYIELSRLVVKYSGNYTKHEIIFPMAGTGDENSTMLLFKHLTAGLKISLKTLSSSIEVASLKVVVQGSDAADDVTLDGVTYRTRWAVQGPLMPGGDIGGIDGNRDITYASEMYFDMEEPGHDYVTIGTSGIGLFIPVTVNDLKRITIIGYASDNTQLFAKSKVLNTDSGGQYPNLQRNHIYIVPTIEIE